LKKLGENIIDYGNKIENLQQAASLSQLIGVVKTREAYSGCKQLLGNWLILKQTDLLVKGNKDCLYPYDDPKWKLDPCCNFELRETQCCKPSDYTIKTNVIDGIKTEVIDSICTNPKKIQSLIGNLVEASKTESLDVFKPEDDYMTLFKPLDECRRAIFETTCTADTDCIYSSKCTGGFCKVDYMNPGPALIKCFIASMDQSLLLEFRSILKLPTQYDSPADAISNTTAKILQLASSEDCAGPESGKYQRRTEWKPDLDGNYNSIQIPGDKVGCLSVKECSFKPWERKDELSCKAGNLAGFCGQCNGGWCNTITEYGSCSSWDLSQEDCTQAGGVFQYGKCVYPDKNTETKCLVGANCDPTMTDFKESRCSRTICYNSQITTQDACTDSNYMWSASLKLCIRNKWDITKSECTNSNNVYVPGVQFFKGRFDTKELCPSESCDNFDVLMNNGNKAECESKGFCDASCAKCISNKYYDGACQLTKITDLQSCQNIGGDWVPSDGVSVAGATINPPAPGTGSGCVTSGNAADNTLNTICSKDATNIPAPTAATGCIIITAADGTQKKNCPPSTVAGTTTGGTSGTGTATGGACVTSGDAASNSLKTFCPAGATNIPVPTAETGCVSTTAPDGTQKTACPSGTTTTKPPVEGTGAGCVTSGNVADNTLKTVCLAGTTNIPAPTAATGCVSSFAPDGIQKTACPPATATGTTSGTIQCVTTGTAANNDLKTNCPAGATFIPLPTSATGCVTSINADGTQKTACPPATATGTTSGTIQCVTTGTAAKNDLKTNCPAGATFIPLPTSATGCVSSFNADGTLKTACPPTTNVKRQVAVPTGTCFLRGAQKDTCVMADSKWVNCKDNISSDKCGDSTNILTKTMGCQWRNFDRCENETECNSTGNI
jgi:hypothetical protein